MLIPSPHQKILDRLIKELGHRVVVSVNGDNLTSLNDRSGPAARARRPPSTRGRGDSLRPRRHPPGTAALIVMNEVGAVPVHAAHNFPFHVPLMVRCLVVDATHDTDPAPGSRARQRVTRRRSEH